MQEILTNILLGLYTLTIIGIILVVITDNRNPLKTVPWILVLLLAPVVGLLVYFFFGQNLSKRHIISRRTRKRITTHLKESDCSQTHLPPHHRPLVKMLQNTAHAVPLYGSRLTPYIKGEEKMNALLEAIHQAKHHIHIQYYIFMDDRTGCRLRDALIEKAHQGIIVRILYDDMGCHSVQKPFFEQMRQEGIDIRPFLHVHFPVFSSKFNYRNHRKIVVIDGCVGFMGGMNIADRYVDGTSWGTWRDTHLRIEGAGVAGLQASFLSDWSATTKQNISAEEYYPQMPSYTTNILQVVSGGPFGKWRTLLQADSFAITRAHHHIRIQTPYYLPSDVLNSSLQEAALAGIEVELMLPERSDVKTVNLASHSFLDDMIKAGVKILFYQPGFLHSKLLLIDDDLTVLGSANMDFRSFEHNFEVNAFIYDKDFTAQMIRIFEQDTKHCRPVSPHEWFHRPRRQRLAESFMRIFAPLM